MPTPAPAFTLAPASSSTWDALSAIGTIFAGLVALGIALGPVIAARRRSPILTPELSGREPHVRLAQIINGPRAFYLRLLIRNTGNAEARRVRVTLTDWFILEPMQGAPDWAREDVDPAALHWVSMPHSSEQVATFAPTSMGSAPRSVLASTSTNFRPTPPEVNLPPGLYDLVDVIEYVPGTSMRTILDDERPRGFAQRAHKHEGQFMLTVTVTAENATGITRTIFFRTDGGNGFADVGFREPPIESRNAGLLSMLDAVAKEARALRKEGRAVQGDNDKGNAG